MSKKEFEGMSSSLQSAIKSINKAYSDGEDQAIIDLSYEDRQVETIGSFGSLGVDLAVGVGGIPKGRIIEIYGPESSGKTTLCLHALINIQKQGKVGAFIDAEQAFDVEYFKALGGNVSQLIFSQPNSGEQGLNIAEKLVNQGVDLIIIDSVAALVPESELRGEMEDHSVGVLARLMARALRKLQPAMRKSGTTIIFINQIRQKIGVVFGSPETTPGGEALKFSCSIRLDIRRKGINKHTENGKEIKDSNKTKLRVIKNKVAPPFKECEFDIIYGKGIDKISELPAVAEELGLLHKVKSKYCLKYDPLFSIWGMSEPIESTINYVGEVLKEPECWYLREELENMVDFTLNQITIEELESKFKVLKSNYETKEKDFERYWELGSEASSKSEHSKAIFWLQKAHEEKPWEKTCKTRLSSVQKRVEEKLDKGENIEEWVNGLDGNEYNIFTGDIRPYKIKEEES